MASIINFNDFKLANEQEKVKYSLDYFYLMIDRMGIEDHYQNCCVCEWDKAGIDLCLMNKRAEYKLEYVVPLCPNHNKLFYLVRLENQEWLKIGKFLWTVCDIINPFHFS